jgi:hypothetical protein
MRGWGQSLNSDPTPLALILGRVGQILVVDLFSIFGSGHDLLHSR